MTTTDSKKRFHTSAEADSYLGLAQGVTASWRNRGRGPAYIKLGRKVVYATEDLDAFLAASRTVPSRQHA